jgi:hypothetical protein
VFVAVYSNRLKSEIAKNVVPAVVQAGLLTKQVVTYLTALTAGDVLGVPGIANKIILAGVQAYKSRVRTRIQLFTS